MSVRLRNPPAQAGPQGVPPCAQHTLEPAYPPTDEELKDRINEKAGSPDRGTKHEAAAARHNQAGILRTEGDLRRAPAGRASAVSGEGEANQIRFYCTVCGRFMPGEVDHVSTDKDGTRNAVEAKAGTFPGEDAAQIERNTRQMERLGAMAQNSGMGVVYKIPATESAAPITNLANQLGVNVTVIPI